MHHSKDRETSQTENDEGVGEYCAWSGGTEKELLGSREGEKREEKKDFQGERKRKEMRGRTNRKKLTGEGKAEGPQVW